MQLRQHGNTKRVKIVKEITVSPKRGAKNRKAFICHNSAQEKSQLTPFQTLLMFVEEELSWKEYEIIRTIVKKPFPCYSIIKKAKRKCYPDPGLYCVLVVTLQGVLNHISKRLLIFAIKY